MSACMTKEAKIWTEHVEGRSGLALQLNRPTRNLEEMFWLDQCASLILCSFCVHLSVYFKKSIKNGICLCIPNLST